MLPVSADIKPHTWGTPLCKKNTESLVNVEKILFPHMAPATGWEQQQPALAHQALQFHPFATHFPKLCPGSW